MQIHDVEERVEERWVLDPVHGPTQKRELAANRSTTSVISVPAGGFASCPEGQTFELGADGSFDVPEDVAAHFLRMPGWHVGISPFPPEDLKPEEPIKVSKVSDKSGS